MLSATDRRIAELRDGLRADYLWPTKHAARLLCLHPNKFSTWWYATRRKLRQLAAELPRETAAELMSILAESDRHEPD